jgi:hypothetical protein
MLLLLRRCEEEEKYMVLIRFYRLRRRHHPRPVHMEHECPRPRQAARRRRPREHPRIRREVRVARQAWRHNGDGDLEDGAEGCGRLGGDSLSREGQADGEGVLEQWAREDEGAGEEWGEQQVVGREVGGRRYLRSTCM